jgi:hypothetical protein
MFENNGKERMNIAKLILGNRALSLDPTGGPIDITSSDPTRPVSINGVVPTSGGGGGGGVTLANISPWTGKQPLLAGAVLPYVHPLEFEGDINWESALPPAPRPTFKNLSMVSKALVLPAPISYITNDGLTSFSRCPIRVIPQDWRANEIDHNLDDNYIRFWRGQNYDPRTSTKDPVGRFYDVRIRAVISIDLAVAPATGFMPSLEATKTLPLLVIPPDFSMLRLGGPETYEMFAVGTKVNTIPTTTTEFTPLSMIVDHTGNFSLREDFPFVTGDITISIAMEWAWDSQPHGTVAVPLELISLEDFVIGD